MATIHMLIGIPGSGKSTYAKELAKKDLAKIKKISKRSRHFKIF